MTSKVNADNTLGGVILTGDSSGILELQAGGVTKVTVGPSGMTLADVLPVASGGTGTTTTPPAGAIPYGTGTTQAYTAAGTSGQVLTSGGTSAPSWGTVAIAAGGTGQTTATAAFDALAPSQSSNSGKFLTTNGSTTSWATVTIPPSGPSIGLVRALAVNCILP